MRPSKHCAGLFISGLGVFFLLGALGIHFYGQHYVSVYLSQQLILTSTDAFAYKSFQNSTASVNIYQAWYLFNTVNDYEVTNFGATPIVQEMGPYTFQEFNSRPEENITWQTDGTVRYIDEIYYSYRQDKSGKGVSLDDTISTPLLGALGIYKVVQYSDNATQLLKSCLDLTGTKSFFINLTVRELLYGYADPTVACLLEIESILVPTGTDVTPWVQIVKQGRNNTSFQHANRIYTGAWFSTYSEPAPPPNRANYLAEWRGMTELTGYWNNDSYAEMINGTTGGALTPGEPKVGQQTYAFMAAFDRSIPLEGKRSVKVSGVSVVEYGWSPRLLEPGSINPDNIPFGQTIQGLLPASNKSQDPCTFSKPYFLDSDLEAITPQFLSRDITELTPALRRELGKANTSNAAGFQQRDIHDSYQQFEPLSGIMFGCRTATQINVLLRNDDRLGPTASNLPKSDGTYLPVLYSTNTYELSSHYLKEFKDLVLFPVAIIKGGIAGLAVIGCISIVAGISLWYKGKKEVEAEGERLFRAHVDEMEKRQRRLNHYGTASAVR